MVQRKLSHKPDHHKNQNQSQDVTIKNNNRVADLRKKKMKKSGSTSIKRPEIDSPSFRNHSKHPGKLPPSPSPSSVAAAGTTPNYMKPTTSSDARTQVSTADSPILRRNINPKLTLASANKAASASLKTTKNPSFKPARKCSPVVVLCENLVSQKATCSSTLKDCKFPAYLSLNPGGTESAGTSAIKVCPYTYCSLNGHHHAPLPPLKCFLSARRRVTKKNRVKGPTSFDEKLAMRDDSEGSKISCPVVEEEQRDFFIEIYSERIEDEKEPICFGVDDKDKTLDRNRDFSPVQEERKSGLLPIYDEVDSESSSDMDLYDCEYSTGAEIESDPEIGGIENRPTDGEFMTKSDDKGGWFDEFVVDQVSQESMDEESLSSDAFSTSDDDNDDDSIDSYDYLQSFIMMKNSALVQAPVEEPETEPSSDDKNHSIRIGDQETDYCIFEEDTSFDDLKHKSLQNEDTITVTGDQAETFTSDDESRSENQEIALLKCTEVKAENASISETEDSALARGAAKFKKPIEDTDNELGLFNPRGPNFLPIEPDPEAEKVDLRHQDLDEKKNAEEWMVDYALRQVVTKLGPARKRKVALLVEAFERVTPVGERELHSSHRPIQACS